MYIDPLGLKRPSPWRPSLNIYHLESLFARNNLMWSACNERLSHGRILKTIIKLGAFPITFGEVLHDWEESPGFRSFFIGLLAQAPFVDFRWETPPVTIESITRPFEYVLLDSPGLASVPDSDVFAEHFDQPTRDLDVVSFPNLGKDTVLIVPRPLGPQSAYRHLAAFVREAPEQQKHSLWRTVGQVMQHSLGSAPIWLSTAVAGVSWLHVRIDKRPKYYGYRPYVESRTSASS
jgi:hypothetical protein